jgi:hypothetical protein
MDVPNPTSFSVRFCLNTKRTKKIKKAQGNFERFLRFAFQSADNAIASCFSRFHREQFRLPYRY